MKKLIMVLMTAAAMTAMSCGDGRNTARENDDDDMDNTEIAEPDTTSMESDTTSTRDLNERDRNDRDDGVEDSETEGRSERDTIQ
jgi:hypothetical protein